MGGDNAKENTLGAVQALMTLAGAGLSASPRNEGGQMIGAPLLAGAGLLGDWRDRQKQMTAAEAFAKSLGDDPRAGVVREAGRQGKFTPGLQMEVMKDMQGQQAAQALPGVLAPKPVIESAPDSLGLAPQAGPAPPQLATRDVSGPEALQRAQALPQGPAVQADVINKLLGMRLPQTPPQNPEVLKAKAAEALVGTGRVGDLKTATQVVEGMNAGVPIESLLKQQRPPKADRTAANMEGDLLRPATQAYLEAVGRGDMPAQEKALADIAKIKESLHPHQPHQATDKDKAIADWMAGKNLPDTPANRTKAREALKETPSINVGSQFTPDALEMAARAVANGAPPPAMGWGKAATEARIKILNRAAEIMKANGDGLGALSLQQAGFRANEAELKKLQTQRGPILAFAATTEKNLAVAEQLSDQVDRSGVPVLNRWLNAGKRSVEGDVGIVKFDAAVRTAINEFAKVTSSATGGGVTSDAARKEVESILNTVQTKEQFQGVVQLLRREMQNRRQGFEEQIATVQKALLTGPAAPAPAAAPGQPAQPTPQKVQKWTRDPSGKLVPVP